MLLKRMLVIVLTLIVTDVVRSITIDSKLQVIRNDCYERLAIGQRLDEKDIYRETESKTIMDCQLECTKDEEMCRSFSFGIGVKGNGTCELSSYVVKETFDLKPIGTSPDTDYDLYIKKLGCKLILNPTSETPVQLHDAVPTVSSDRHVVPTGNSIRKPQQYNNDNGLPNNLNIRPSNERNRDQYYKQTYDERGPYKVQSLVSVSPGNNGYGDSYHHESSESHGSSHSHFEEHGSSYRPDNQYGGYGLLGHNSHRDTPYRRDGYEAGFPTKPNKATKPYNPLETSFTRPKKPNEGSNYAGSIDRFPDDYSHTTYTGPSRPEQMFPHDGAGYSHGTQLSTRPSNIAYDQPTNRPYKRPFDSASDYNKTPLQSPPFRPSHLNHPYDNNDGHISSNYPGRPNDPDNPNYFSLSDRYDSHAAKPVSEFNYDDPVRPMFKPDQPEGVYFDQRPNEHNKIPAIYSPKYPHQKPIVTETVGPNGQLITSIITEISNVCYRRALAGKRVMRSLVRRAVSCERVEECQQECADEKHFVCEGFNYRLDPSGRGQGDCELLHIPFVRLDVHRDLITDPDYDYYQKERNSYPDCKSRRPESYRPGSGGAYVPQREPPSYYDTQPLPPIKPSYNLNRPPYADRYPASSYDRHGDLDYHREKNRFDSQFYRDSDRRVDDERYGGRNQPYNRRGDGFGSYHSQESYEDSYHYKVSNKNEYHSKYHDGYHYPANTKPDYIDNTPPRDYKPYEPYLPSYNRFNDYDRKRYDDKNHWGFDDKGWGSYGGTYGDFGRRESGEHRHSNQNHNRYDDGFYEKKYNFPQPVGGDKDWGKYGGSYGTGGNFFNNYDKKDVWGFNSGNENKFVGYGRKETFFDHGPPIIHQNDGNGKYLPDSHNDVSNYRDDAYHSGVQNYRFVKDECSLRSATGFRLYKGIVKKIRCVPNIYECEMLCYKERDFTCTSFAFRYTIGPSVLVDNCYLSDKDYRELDYYTDLEQDRDFDIYTMNNKDRCDDVETPEKHFSECFWHIRSGQRLEDRCVKTSLTVPSIVECQIECLKSSNFICRAFAFRYGSPVIGGPKDNCQLTDRPFYELELRFEPEFEIYERGSFGRGCEINHFAIKEQGRPGQTLQADQICYVGYGKPAALLREATDKALIVETELECKKECSRAREQSPFHCMSFSYRSAGTKDEPNCCLSSIFQRDLTENVDYIREQGSWLFAWDHYNPVCQNVENKGDFQGIDTWKVYSVGGWPCKRGSPCKQNKEVGFWFCDLEGGTPSSWDYCCRPDHQCGYSEGYPYQWCYVGPSSTQWRKCSDRYYPYTHAVIITNKPHHNNHNHNYPAPTPVNKPYLPDSYGPDIRPYPDFNKPSYLPAQPIKTSGYREPRPWETGRPITNLIELEPAYRPSFRPDRPNAPLPYIPEKPSLNQYETAFDNEFLDPPRPGGFGPPRHWPVSYLHKETPPNVTTPIEHKYDRMQMKNSEEPKFDAIQNLIHIIKSNDLKNIQYQITNDSNKADDVLYVQIPLPSNFSDNNSSDKISADKLSDPVDLLPPKENSSVAIKINRDRTDRSTAQITAKETSSVYKRTPLYRKSFITRTNITNYGRSFG